jgi:hypothetical protein
MTKRTFFVRAIWDDEDQVFYSDSDILGLHIEADTIEEFRAVLAEVGPALIVANHITTPDLVHTPVKDWLPTIVCELPPPTAGR